MTTPVPSTWASLAILTAAQLNAEVRDVLKFLIQPPQTSVWHNATQSIPNGGTPTAVAFNQEAYDRAGGAGATQHDVAINNSRVVPNAAGIYLCQVHLSYEAQAVAVGTRHAFLRLNGGDYVAEGMLPMSAVFNALDVKLSTSVVREFNGTTDYVEACALQTSGGALNLLASASTTPCTLTVTRLG